MNSPLIQRREFRVFLLVLIPFLLFLSCYWSEIWLASTYFVDLVLFNPSLRWGDQTRVSMGMLGYECLVFAGLFLVSLILVAQFVLPVQTREERGRVIWRLWLHARERHGPAIFIKNGAPIASQAERENRRTGPGIALVDSVSALALERETVSNLDLRPKTSAHVEGAGIVFTDSDEAVRDTLDLRRQTRSRPNIKGLTRDGLEVTTSINVTFMLDDESSAANANKTPSQRNNPPFSLNKRNAFRAVYGSPVSKGEDEDEVKKWTDLPAFVASDIFRDMISTYTLDSLYRPNEDGELPLDILRREFNERVKEERVLKDRGIKILSAGFGKFTMPDPVTEQRISSWWAEWERRKLEVLAGGNLEAARIVQRARVAAQYDMVRQMDEILQNARDPKVLVALRLFQALEAASGQPPVRRLLPTETVEVLKNWLDSLLIWFGRRPNTK